MFFTNGTQLKIPPVDKKKESLVSKYNLHLELKLSSPLTKNIIQLFNKYDQRKEQPKRLLKKAFMHGKYI